MKKWILGFVLSCPLAAAAMLPHAPSDAEVAALPRFCAIKFKRPGPDSESQFGRANWTHMHHYCHGLKFVNRARNYPKDRGYYLDRAKGEYRYVFRATQPDFWFRPQMYMEMARIHLQLDEKLDAQKLLYEAIRLNPRYEPAYLVLVELLRQGGVKDAALTVSTQGVRYLPESRALQQAYLDSGGEMPFPAGIDDKASSPSSSGPVAGGASQADGAIGADDQAAATHTEEVPSSGCRFCPPEEISERWRESFQTGE